MKVVIYKDNLVKFGPFDRKYELILSHNGIESSVINVNDDDFWKKVKACDAFIYRWTHHDGPTIHADILLPIISNELEKPCFPDLNASWLFNDKIKEFYLLKQFGFPVVESYIFWNKQDALDWVGSKAKYPVVFKLKRGAGSNNVILVHDSKEAGKLVNRMFGRGLLTGGIPGRSSLSRSQNSWVRRSYIEVKKMILYQMDKYDLLDWVVHKNYVYFQDFHPDNSFDTRVTIIGERAFSFRRQVRENDFRASGSGKINYSIDDVDQQCIEIAFQVSKKFNYRSMAYDFVYDHAGNPLLVEISYTYNDNAIYMCSGYWDTDMNWHDGHFWPQYLHLVDLLGIPELVQPKIEPSAIQ